MDSIKKELKNYYFVNKIEDIVFIGYDNKESCKRKNRKKKKKQIQKDKDQQQNGILFWWHSGNGFGPGSLIVVGMFFLLAFYAFYKENKRAINTWT